MAVALISVLLRRVYELAGRTGARELGFPYRDPEIWLRCGILSGSRECRPARSPCGTASPGSSHRVTFRTCGDESEVVRVRRLRGEGRELTWRRLRGEAGDTLDAAEEVGVWVQDSRELRQR